MSAAFRDGKGRSPEIGTLPETMRSVLAPVLQQIESLSEQIHTCDKELEQIARTQYPETELPPLHGLTLERA